MALGFAKDIRPLFRDYDIQEMRHFGGFDLSAYNDVKKHYIDIAMRLEAEDMPCDAPWSKENIAKFAQWISDGMMP